MNEIERQHAKAQILQIFDTRAYICLLGPVGSGKRTLLAAVGRELAARTRPVCPVYIRASSLAGLNGEGLYRHVGEYVAYAADLPLPDIQVQTQASFVRLLGQVVAQTAGGMVLLIDGLDQAGATTARELLTALREADQKSRMKGDPLAKMGVVVSGSADLEELSRNAQVSPFNTARRVYLKDFTLEEITALMAVQLGEPPDVSLVEQVQRLCGGVPLLVQWAVDRLQQKLELDGTALLRETALAEEMIHRVMSCERLAAIARALIRQQSLLCFPLAELRRAYLAGLLRSEEELQLRTELWRRPLAEALGEYAGVPILEISRTTGEAWVSCSGRDPVKVTPLDWQKGIVKRLAAEPGKLVSELELQKAVEPTTTTIRKLVYQLRTSLERYSLNPNILERGADGYYLRLGTDVIVR